MNDNPLNAMRLSKRRTFMLVPSEEQQNYKFALVCRNAGIAISICAIIVLTLTCLIFAVLLLLPAIAHGVGTLVSYSGSAWLSLAGVIMALGAMVHRRVFLPPPTHLLVSPGRIAAVQSVKISGYYDGKLDSVAKDDSYNPFWGDQYFGVLASVRWEDIIRLSAFVDKNGSQMLCFHICKGKVVKMRLGDRLGNYCRKALLDGLKQWAPNAICEPEAQALLEPRPETSYTELWISALAAAPERNRMAPLEPGAIVRSGKYEIKSQLGAGGQAIVYLARETERASIKEVVLKEYILPIGVTRKATKEAIEVLENEAKLLERLDHPRIVKLLDFFIEDHRGYMAFERVAGENLRELVRRDGVLSEKKVRDIAIKVCHVLKYLHSQEPPVLHKDLSPDNLILKEDGELKLIDFAVAQQTQATATALAQGKRSYMPPEQFRGRPTVQSDLYALGCSMYFLAVGEDPEPLSACHPKLMRTELSDGLDFIVAGCTQFDASTRYKSTLEVLSDLERL